RRHPRSHDRAAVGGLVAEPCGGLVLHHDGHAPLDDGGRGTHADAHVAHDGGGHVADDHRRHPRTGDRPSHVGYGPGRGGADMLIAEDPYGWWHFDSSLGWFNSFSFRRWP